MENFEENLKKLEKITNDIKRSDISLEDALKNFEEGIKLASGMEKQLDEIEGKIQILMNDLCQKTTNLSLMILLMTVKFLEQEDEFEKSCKKT